MAPVSSCGSLSVEHVVEMGTLQASSSFCPDGPQRLSPLAPAPVPLTEGQGPSSALLSLDSPEGRGGL